AEPTPIPEDDDPLDFPTEDPVEDPIPSTDPIVVTPPVTDPIVLPPVIDPLVLPPVVVPPVVVPVDPNAKLTIKVSGRQLLVDGKAFTIKGVCYNPVPKGAGELSGTLFSNPTAAHLVALEQDFKLMQEAGINTIRTYSVIENAKVLALLNKYGLFVIVPVMNVHTTTDKEVKRIVNLLKNHRSTLMWQVGNEWNYNLLYGGWDYAKTAPLVKNAGTIIKATDSSHPVMTNWGEIPSKAIVDEFSMFDIWGLNIYRSKSFDDSFSKWKAVSTKPMFIGEYGADAFNALTNREDTNSQGIATEALTKEIMANLSATSSDKAALGGTIFEWNDEWWKDQKGTQATHDNGGIAPGGGPYPDGTFNEEWWGVVDIDRNPRPAYNILKALWKN
ncbi:MAG: hypothetical protein EOP07_24795, partial [Proteobacteria bacterium]